MIRRLWGDGGGQHWRIVVLGALLVAELVALVAVVHWEGARARHRLDELYATPVPLRVAAPGTPIRVWRLTVDDVPGRVFGVLYHSRSPRGRDIAVSGYIAIPDGAPPAGGRPVVALAHGTVGGADGCAPSRHPADDRSTILPVLAKGWIVAATDLEGIGGTGPHPYLVGEAEARSMLDAVRATRALLPHDAGDRFIAWGISQGGHAALFARQAAARWAPELAMQGAVALAPVSDVATFVSEPTIAPAAVTLLAVSGYTAAYAALHADQVLSTEGLDHLADVEDECLVDLNRPLSDTPLGDLRPVPPDALPAWRAKLDLNRPGQVPTPVPLLLVQGTKDPIVPIADTRSLFDDVCEQGAAARLTVIAGASHADVVRSGRAAYLAWMTARFAGTPAPSNCGRRH